MAGIAVAVMAESGAPQVGITVTGLNASTSSVISIDTSWDGGASWWPVRGAQSLSVLSGTFIRDFVPALNVGVTYRMTVESGATIPATLQAGIVVPSSLGWIQDPLDPRGAVPISGFRIDGAIMLIHPSASELVRRQPFDVAAVEGTAYPVASIGLRQAPSQVPLVLRAVTKAQAALIAALRKLLASAGTVVIRGLPADVPLDPVANAVLGDVSEVPVVGNVLGLRNDWQLSATIVRPTATRIVVPWFTYNAVASLWAPSTYDAAKAARPADSYLDWVRDPEPPG